MTKTEALTNTPKDIPESRIAALLQYRFGGGLVYLPRRQHSGELDSQARQRGYIDAGGYLTRKGRTLIASYYYM